MKKLLMSLALVGSLAAMSAKGVDSYIYWMADASSNATIYDRGVDYAKLIGRDGDGGVQTLGYAAMTKTETSLKTADRLPSDKLLASQAVTDYENWTFYVELYNGEWKNGTSETYSWQELASKDAIYQSTLTGGLGKVAFTSFTYNAPEPTSGLLVLFGLCGLALKRKRA